VEDDRVVVGERDAGAAERLRGRGDVGGGGHVGQGVDLAGGGDLPVLAEAAGQVAPGGTEGQHGGAGQHVVERLLLDRIDAQAAGTAVGSEHQTLTLPGAHEAAAGAGHRAGGSGVDTGRTAGGHGRTGAQKRAVTAASGRSRSSSGVEGGIGHPRGWCLLTRDDGRAAKARRGPEVPIPQPRWHGGNPVSLDVARFSPPRLDGAQLLPGLDSNIPVDIDRIRRPATPPPPAPGGTIRRKQ
jgi:hypothetical protein